MAKVKKSLIKQLGHPSCELLEALKERRLSLEMSREALAAELDIDEEHVG